MASSVTRKGNGWDAFSERTSPDLIAGLVQRSGLDTRVVVRYLKGLPTKPDDRTELETVLPEFKHLIQR